MPRSSTHFHEKTRFDAGCGRSRFLLAQERTSGIPGTLLRHAVASLYRVTVGYYAAVVTAVPLGLILGRWRLGQQAFNALIQFLRPISPLAWIPLAVLWFGIGDRPAVFLIFLSRFFQYSGLIRSKSAHAS